MPSVLAQTTIRFKPDVNYKIRYIADDNFRPLNSEITMLVLKRIAEYEAVNGVIAVPDDLSGPA